ncbi:hypothetical protein [Gordonia sp. NB41Y]|uniref:hypothetical protein n=1 Tax=Gordonia sp. NB41Y TaxID=875808 RepID=UPI000346921C|nr:hypothetical protein [Gordonia sp. NB41Y]WLP92879.1 hypothetical protein Q9K23_11970 [Gordonia sp. NB41Y]
MTARRSGPAMSDDVERNLDTQARRLMDLEAVIEQALTEETVGQTIAPAPQHQTYEQLTEFNDEFRAEQGWTSVELEETLTDSQRDALEKWRRRHRLQWSTVDLAMLGAVGLVGALSAWLDSETDSKVLALGTHLKDLDRVRGWEQAGARLPIDYMERGFGGPAHRIKSSGHDLARILDSLKQIRDGEFRGIAWLPDGVGMGVKDGRYAGTESWFEAAGLLAKHLGADIVTPMGLPIPGMSYLANCKNKALRDFARDSYSGMRPGEGWNLRSGLLTPGLAVTATELIVRTHVHGMAMLQTGSPRLDEREAGKRSELLLAAHTLVSAMSVGKVSFVVGGHLAMGNRRDAFRPQHIRHLNIPALLRAGTLAVTVTRNEVLRRRIPRAASWDQLLGETGLAWQLWRVPSEPARVVLES